MMKISVIIPVFNVEPYISACIESVLNQDYPDLEVIIVNDCTPDSSVEIARDIIGKHLRGACVRIISHDHNQGQSAARNTGIEAATGNYLYFLDGDDYLPHDALSRLSQPAIAHGGVDFVIGNYDTVGALRPMLERLKLPDGVLTGNHAILRSFYHGKWHVLACNSLLRADFIRDNGLRFPPGLIHEDELWVYCIATCARSMGVVNAVTYHYVLHPGAVTSTVSRRNLDGLINVAAAMHRYIADTPRLQSDKYAMSVFEKKKFRFFQKIYKRSGDAAYTFEAYRLLRSLRFPSAPLCLPQALTALSYRLPLRQGYKFYAALEWLYYKKLRIKQRLSSHA